MTSLSSMLEPVATSGPLHAAAVDVVLGLSSAAVAISAIIRYPGEQAGLGDVRGTANADGDSQKALDVLADEMIQTALAGMPCVAAYLSEEQDDAVILHDDGQIIVASDPLDGYSNIDTNVSIGTIFSILPASGGHLQAGRNQIAAGFFVYGPQTTLLLSFGDHVMALQLGEDGQFHEMDWLVQIPQATTEFSINASNLRHWTSPVSNYIGDCLAGHDGPRETDFNMRWVGSLVADGWRIFRRGGVFLYPADARPGYDSGRLRLVYEANPVAFLIEAAGGKATDGMNAILDQVPASLHERVPLVFGSANEVDEITGYGS